jgi:hypothetical protein
MDAELPGFAAQSEAWQISVQTMVTSLGNRKDESYALSFAKSAFDAV